MIILKQHFLKKHHNPILILITFISSTVALITKNSNLDYHAYTLMWQSVLNGNNPWGPWGQNFGNLYGPAYNLLAPIYFIHPLLPKLLFVWCWCWISHKLIQSLFISQKNSQTRFQILYLIILFTPFIWARIFIQGANEIVVGFFCFLSIKATTENKSIKAGMWLSMGTLFKFYPLALLPILSQRSGKLNYKLIVSTFFFIVNGYLLTYMIWGESFLYPIHQAYSRVSTSAGDSIFNFIKSEYFPISKIHNQNLDWLSKYLILLFSFLVYLKHFIKPMKIEAACTLVMLIIFTFYGTGFSQYHIPVFILSFDWLTKEKNLFKSNKMLRLGFILYFTYHSLFRPVAKILWEIILNGDINNFFKIIPLISFPIFLFLIIGITLSPESLANYLRKNPTR